MIRELNYGVVRSSKTKDVNAFSENTARDFAKYNPILKLGDGLSIGVA